VRRVEVPGGNRTAQEANAGVPKGSRKPGVRPDLQRSPA